MSRDQSIRQPAGRLVRERGSRVIAQDAAGCAVYGMPKAVIESDLADRATQLAAIPATIHRELRK